MFAFFAYLFELFVPLHGKNHLLGISPYEGRDFNMERWQFITKFASCKTIRMYKRIKQNGHEAIIIFSIDSVSIA